MEDAMWRNCCNGVCFNKPGWPQTDFVHGFVHAFPVRNNVALEFLVAQSAAVPRLFAPLYAGQNRPEPPAKRVYGELYRGFKSMPFHKLRN